MASLSCNLIQETTTKLMGLVRFDRMVGTLNMLGALPLSSFTPENATLEQIRQAMTIG